MMKTTIEVHREVHQKVQQNSTSREEVQQVLQKTSTTAQLSYVSLYNSIIISLYCNLVTNTTLSLQPEDSMHRRKFNNLESFVGLECEEAYTRIAHATKYGV